MNLDDLRGSNAGDRDDWAEEVEQRFRLDLLGAVRLYREFGLFLAYAHLGDVEVAEALYDGLAAVLLDSDEPPDALLLTVEKSRAFMMPLNWNTVPDGDAYKRILDLCARISQGAFLPQDTAEDWSQPEHVKIRFTLDGQPQSMTADRYEPLDLAVIGQVNRLIEASRRRFVYSLGDFGDGALFVACFSFEEWQRIKDERPEFSARLHGGWT
jgi:hypothetical protein